MNSEKPTQEDFENWHKDPNNWYLGFLYYNPQDKRLLPPKKIKELGWTVNFANPYSVFILIAILALIPLIHLLK
ncbi:DUF5808 domain-containing protein [Flavobacterium sp.]|uniref:DUF5808 domain-containing protein n=1 Tax=Flavobacterium sp. TaxID=239 RepID=UPI003263B028